MSSPTTFGALLRQLRKRAGMTQGDLAAAVGYSVSFICDLEQARRLPVLQTVVEQFVPALGLQDEPHFATRLLELAATGGTRVNRALRWAYEQFEEVPEAEFRLLFLLSDFEFFESPRDLEELTGALASQNVRYLGAAHGHFSKKTAEHFQSALGGQLLKLRNLDAVPGLLMDAIRDAS